MDSAYVAILISFVGAFICFMAAYYALWKNRNKK